MEKIVAKNKKNRLISIFLLILLILPTLLLSLPKKASAILGAEDTVEPGPVWATILGVSAGSQAVNTGANYGNLGLHIKDIATAILQQLVTTFERRLLQQLTQSTINWINSGFSGSPLFIQNPGSFFQQIAKQDVQNLVTIIGYDPNTYPFGESFALNIINSYKRQFADNAAYSLAKVMQNPAQFANCSFGRCGWSGLLINTQYPQNNYLGFQMTAMNELARQLQGTSQNAAQTVRTTLQQSMGFLSPKSCPSNPQYNNGVNEFQKPAAFDPSSVQNNDTTNPPPTCNAIQLETLQTQCNNSSLNTSLIKGTTNLPAGCATVDQDLQNCNTAWATYNTNFSHQQGLAYNKWADTNLCPGGLQVTTPGGVVANHIMTALGTDFQKTVLGSMITNSLSAIVDALTNHFIGQGLTALTNTITSAPTDNWTYEGVSLGNSTTTVTSSSNTQNVSINAGNTATVTLSFGTAPYTKNVNSDNTIATSTLSGSTLTITGIAPGSTSVVIQDSSSPARTVTVYITVTGVSNVDFKTQAPLNIRIAPGNVANIIMSGGTQPYSVQTQADTSVAEGLVSDNNLQIDAIAASPNPTSLVVQDSAGAMVTINITVGTVGNPILSVDPQTVSVAGGTGLAGNITISGGTPPYSIQTMPDPAVATAVPLLDGVTISIYGSGESQNSTSLVVQDSSSPVQTATVGINVSGAPTTTGGGTTTTNPTTADFDTQNFPVEITMNGNSSISINFSGGTGPYDLATQPNTDVASAQINPNNPNSVVITGTASGGATIFFVEDSTGKRIQVDVTVNGNGSQ